MVVTFQEKYVPKASDLLNQGRREDLWQMCCGYLDLDIDGFMEIQERLLLKQLELLNNCALGKKLFRSKKPENMEEFRRLAPITTYKDYCPELLEKREETLPAKPIFWVHTARQDRRLPVQMGADDGRLCAGT